MRQASVGQMRRRVSGAKIIIIFAVFFRITSSAHVYTDKFVSFITVCVLYTRTNIANISFYRYDPTAVLDFLWALTCNPKLWQGRDKFTPKHYVPENILLLEERQLLSLVAYVVAEAVILCNVQNRNAALARMYMRLDLLLHCMSTEDSLIAGVVNYLAERMITNTEYEFYRFSLYMCANRILVTFIYRSMYSTDGFNGFRI